MNKLKKIIKGIKINFLTWRVKRARLKLLLIDLNTMNLCIRCFNRVNHIDIERHADEIKKYISLYDKCINEIESELIAKLRKEVNGE